MKERSTFIVDRRGFADRDVGGRAKLGIADLRSAYHIVDRPVYHVVDRSAYHISSHLVTTRGLTRSRPARRLRRFPSARSRGPTIRTMLRPLSLLPAPHR